MMSLRVEYMYWCEYWPIKIEKLNIDEWTIYFWMAQASKGHPSHGS